jgi:mRNA-degrading endonuclease RelE of RelBE toxin-antitoxin system
MAFNIRMGVPEMEAFWKDLSTRKQAGKLDKNEQRFFKKWVKALGYLSSNPRHTGLGSHEIDELTRKYRLKIFQSYLENETPAAGRMFWAYGPDREMRSKVPTNASS